MSAATGSTSPGTRRSRRSRPSASGDVVEFDLLDACGGQLTATSTVADLASLDFDRSTRSTGPIAVDGAEPGDTLQVDLLEFEPADWGWTASIPGFGLLADEFPDPAYKVTRLPAVGGAGRVPARHPHPDRRRSAASSASRPPTGPRSTIPPDVHGGNMDTRHLTAGLDAVPAGLPRRRALLDRRRPRRPGRRRGLRDRDRDADARPGPPDRPQGPARRPRPEFLTAPDAARRARRRRGATRPTASGRTCWPRPATPSGG